MSIDINWETLTTGPDGLALAETIRDFIHNKFQQVTLPRFIQSVQVHSFDFGAVGPDIVLKDVSDPLPDFYERVDDDGDSEVEDDDDDGGSYAHKSGDQPGHAPRLAMGGETDGPDHAQSPSNSLPPIDTRQAGLWANSLNTEQMMSPTLGIASPGIPGGTSNLGYFHLPLSAGLSGSQTPLAAVAGAQFPSSRTDRAFMPPPASGSRPAGRRRSRSASSISRPSTSDSFAPSLSISHRDTDAASSPPSRGSTTAHHDTHEQAPNEDQAGVAPSPRHFRARQPDDFQVVARVRYAGDVKLSLTAEILLDYPMPSFVGIPVRLNITGLSFDGVAVLAYFRKRAHFCFLSPSDGYALIGDEDEQAGNAAAEGIGGGPAGGPRPQPKPGGLLQEIKVESEIGQRENGRQSLKNVGKVEKFVLEQVRRIFEDEFVYPSFWTFLV